MARDYSRPFYNSKKWKDTRDAYFNSQYGICELCGKPGEEVHHKIFLNPQNINDPYITLGWDNLQLLCRSCHNDIHEKAYEMYRQKANKTKATMNGLQFNENGELVESKNVFIVWGAPASGKTTYVKENKGKYDIVIDLDYIMAALSLTEGREGSEDALPFALEVRDLLYSLIEERKYYFEAVWIVAGLPKKEERETLARRLKAELIHIDTSKEECIKRARQDEQRRYKEQQFKIIKKYFERLEL